MGRWDGHNKQTEAQRREQALASKAATKKKKQTQGRKHTAAHRKRKAQA